jgi:precorrin-6B methylase 1
VTVRVAHEVADADVVAGFATVLAVVDHLIKGQLWSCLARGLLRTTNTEQRPSAPKIFHL